MPLELSCGGCQWRFVGESADAPVICPQCGGMLAGVAPETPSKTWLPALQAAAATPEEDSADFSFLHGPGAPHSAASSLAEDDGDDAPDPSTRTTVYDTPLPPAGGTVLLQQPAAEQRPGPAGDDPHSGRPLNDQSARPHTAAAAHPPQDSGPPAAASDPAIAASAFSPAGPATAATLGRKSHFAFRVLASYASAVTLVCLYLAYLLSRRDPRLDLPDLKPPRTAKNKVTKLQYVRPEAARPTSHTLALGESQRFGFVRLTPLRVTRGPLQFVYYDPAAEESRPDSRAVLKLHLRLENVSRDQEFDPLDRELVFTRENDPEHYGWYKANTLLFAAADRADYDRHVLVYDLSPSSPWLVRGENLDRELKPGELVDVFIPSTEEGWQSLSGPLVWRVHLRKGYNPESLRGVTTLIEIKFSTSDILDESALGCHGCVTPSQSGGA